MYEQTFESIGLSPNEAKIYETLLSSGEVSVSTISSHAHVHRRNVYDALQRLIDRGLVYPVFQKGENVYSAVNPEKLFEIVDEKLKAVKTIMPNLQKLFEAPPRNEAAYIYRGLEGFKNYMRDLVRVSQDTYFLGAKALWFTPGISQHFLDDFIQNTKRKKLNYFSLYDYRVKEEKPEAIPKVKGSYKFLPKKYSAPGVVDIFGDYVVTFTSTGVGNFGEDGMIFVMIHPELAETYRTWFRLIWDLCPVVK